MNFTVRLGNPQGEQLELSYILNSSPSAQVWWTCLQQAVQKSQLENSVFYNFHNGDLPARLAELEEILGHLKQRVPGLERATFSRAQLQYSLNNLHTEFAHSHLLEKTVNEENKPLWRRFNLLIHQIESILIAEKSTALMDLCRIEVLWDENFKTPIPTECYSEYSLFRAFGSVQINYCQVGRQLGELCSAQDAQVPLEHIQPARFFSANATLWFGPDIRPAYIDNYAENVRKFHLENKAKFEAAGVFWERDDKALGSVTVAHLNQNFGTLDDKKLFQREVSRFDRVLSVKC